MQEEESKHKVPEFGHQKKTIWTEGTKFRNLYTPTHSPSGLAESWPHFVVAELLTHHLAERCEELDDHGLRHPDSIDTAARQAFQLQF